MQQTEKACCEIVVQKGHSHKEIKTYFAWELAQHYEKCPSVGNHTMQLWTKRTHPLWGWHNCSMKNRSPDQDKQNRKKCTKAISGYNAILLIHIKKKKKKEKNWCNFESFMRKQWDEVGFKVSWIDIKHPLEMFTP